MAPDEAADALAELPDETSAGILHEMEMEPQNEVTELLEFREDTAGGMMNTEYLVLSPEASVADAIETLRTNEELLEGLNTIYLVGTEGKLEGAVPLARLFVVPHSTPLRELSPPHVISVEVREKEDKITELFDKYNLLSLPVVDENGRLEGVITADDVISVLRQD